MTQADLIEFEARWVRTWQRAHAFATVAFVAALVAVAFGAVAIVVREQTMPILTAVWAAVASFCWFKRADAARRVENHRRGLAAAQESVEAWMAWAQEALPL